MREQPGQDPVLERLELLRIAEEAGVRDRDAASEALARTPVPAQVRGQRDRSGELFGGHDTRDALLDVLGAKGVEPQAARGRQLTQARHGRPVVARSDRTLHTDAGAYIPPGRAG